MHRLPTVHWLSNTATPQSAGRALHERSLNPLRAACRPRSKAPETWALLAGTSGAPRSDRCTAGPCDRSPAAACLSVWCRPCSGFLKPIPSPRGCGRARSPQLAVRGRGNHLLLCGRRRGVRGRSGRRRVRGRRRSRSRRSRRGRLRRRCCLFRFALLALLRLRPLPTQPPLETPTLITLKTLVMHAQGRRSGVSDQVPLLCTVSAAARTPGKTFPAIKAALDVQPGLAGRACCGPCVQAQGG